LAAVGTGEEMWKAIRAHGRPQIVLMDVEMPGEGGIELTKALQEKQPDVRVIMLTAFSDSERVFAALKAGAVGYLLKNVSPEEICRTVERAAEGEPMLSGEIAGRVLREFERRRGGGDPREPARVPERGLGRLRDLRGALRRALRALGGGAARARDADADARPDDRLPLHRGTADHRAPRRHAARAAGGARLPA